MKVLLLLLLVVTASGRVFHRCQLARALKCAGMAGYAGASLGDWVCLARWASHYNTYTRRRQCDGSVGYGIFQMSNRQLCKDGCTPSQNICHVPCRRLLTNLRSAIHCARCAGRRASYWTIWRRHCQGRNVNCYIRGCGV
ncbi:hypothetical protein COCON_G00172370 [Conger conger]|uniref:lysozyme n=2 Tax=Conger conger TaxID=82655 RepID=A0A9Q1HTT6_CONCO|nr:hypothetical protein COCON_G00172370 [Conger conger]